MIFPATFPLDKKNSAERAVFMALSNLPADDFDIFYSKSFRGVTDRRQDDYEIDFIIVDKRENWINSIIIVEVKGGNLSYSGKDNCWFQNGNRMDEGPDEQARKNKHYFISKYRSALAQTPIDWAVWFPEVELPADCEMPTNLDNWQLLDNKSLTNPLLHISEASDEIINNHENLSGISTADYECSLKAGLLRGIGFVQPLNILLKQYEDVYYELAEEQLTYFESLLSIPKLAVSGGAGTGKTMLATSSAIEFSNSGGIVLFLCFNRLLQNALKNTIKLPNVTISTFHSFVYEYINKFDPKWIQNVDYQHEDYYNSTLPNKFTSILEKQPPSQKFDCLIIDEAQDFDRKWIELMFKFTRKESKIVIFFDDNQNIFQRNFTIPSRDKFIPFQLKRNFRNTQKICEFVQSKTGISINPGKTPEGIDVELVSWNLQTELKREINLRLLNLVQIEKIPISDILIIVNGSSRTHMLNDIKNIGDFNVRVSESDETRDANTLYFTSVRKFKGLESPVVFLVLEDVTDFNDNREFYTQCTRAKSILKIFWKG